MWTSVSPWFTCFTEDGEGEKLEAQGYVLTPAPLILASSSPSGVASVATQSSPQSSPLTSPSRPPHSDAAPVGVAGASRAPPPATIPLPMSVPKVDDAAALRQGLTDDSCHVISHTLHPCFLT